MASAPLESDPQDVALDVDDDIKIDPAIGLVFVSGIDAVVQAIKIRVRLFFREWFLNQDIGVPYFEELIGDASKRPGVENRARAVFAAQILDVPGVSEIIQLAVTLNRSTRHMTITFQVRCAFGDTPVVTLEVP